MRNGNTDGTAKYGYDQDAAINLWIGNLRKYNEGELSGGWVALPVDDMCDVLDHLGIDPDRDEYHVPDWECNIPGLKYSEFPNLDYLNELAETWDGMPEYEREAVGVRMDLAGEDFATAYENRDDVRIWHGCINMTDVAYEYVEDCGLLYGVPESIQCYFDYEALGRDLDIEGCFGYSDDMGCMVEVF